MLKETISSAITRFFEAGKYQSLTEAIEADVKDYFLKNYKEQVLKPELRDLTITKGVEQAVRHAHDSYRRVIANGDMRLQLFLAKHTSHLQDISPATPMTNVKLDWDAQKWKAPVYLMEDRAFDGIAGIGAAAAGGTVGALALGPAHQQRARAELRPVVAPCRHLARHAACVRRAGGGGRHRRAADGRPGGWRRASAWLIGAAVDYLGNAANEAFNRDGLRCGQRGGAGRHHRHLEVEPRGQYRHGHRQMVRRRQASVVLAAK